MKKPVKFLGIMIFFLVIVFLFQTPVLTENVGAAAGIKVLSIPAPAFEMPGEQVTYGNNGSLWLNEKAEYVRAPLILPHKTRIKKIQLICKDNHVENNVRMWVHVLSNDMSESFTLCLVRSDSASDDFRIFTTTDISPNKIDNVKYNYFLNLHIPGTKEDGLVFLAAKVWYKGSW